MLLVFLAALTAFILIILFLAWYYKFMLGLIFGKMNTVLDAIVREGAPPKKWEDKFNKRLRKCKSLNKKREAVEWYIRYADARLGDLRAYIEKTSFLPNREAKEEALGSLECFRDEYLQKLDELREHIN